MHPKRLTSPNVTGSQRKKNVRPGLLRNEHMSGVSTRARHGAKSPYPTCSCHYTPCTQGSKTSWVTFPRPPSLSEDSNPGSWYQSPMPHTPKPRTAPLPNPHSPFSSTWVVLLGALPGDVTKLDEESEPHLFPILQKEQRMPG